MADEYEIDTILEELEDGEHESEVAAAEEKADREDPVTHQLRKDVRELGDKFNQEQLQHILEKFDAEADEVEKTLFKNIKAKLKDPERATEAIAEVRELAEPIRQQKAEMMKQAEEDAAQKWGTGPVGSKAAPADADKELMERISQGDMRALTEAVIGADLPF